jgi:hypothetical protein
MLQFFVVYFAQRSSILKIFSLPRKLAGVAQFLLNQEVQIRIFK